MTLRRPVVDPCACADPRCPAKRGMIRNRLLDPTREGDYWRWPTEAEVRQVADKLRADHHTRPLDRTR